MPIFYRRIGKVEKNQKTKYHLYQKSKTIIKMKESEVIKIGLEIWKCLRLNGDLTNVVVLFSRRIQRFFLFLHFLDLFCYHPKLSVAWRHCSLQFIYFFLACSLFIFFEEWKKSYIIRKLTTQDLSDIIRDYLWHYFKLDDLALFLDFFYLFAFPFYCILSSASLAFNIALIM